MKTKKTKDSKYYRDKSYIAEKIAMYSLISLSISIGCGLMSASTSSDVIHKLERDKNQVYQEFMETETFSEIFKQEFEKISTSYINREISFEEFDEKLKYLQTVEYAQQSLQNCNHSLNNKITNIDNEINAQKQKQDKNIITNLCFGAMIATGTTSMAGIASNLVCTTIAEHKEKIEQKNKEDELLV